MKKPKAISASIAFAVAFGASSYGIETVHLGSGVNAVRSVSFAQTASGGGNMPASVTLTWDPPAEGDPMSYVLEAGTGPGLSNIGVFDTATADTRLLVTGVPPGVHYVRVRARTAEGLSEPSNEIVIRVDGNSGSVVSYCLTADRPTGLTSSVSGSLVGLRWTESAGATSYQIEAGSAPGASDLFNGDVGNLTMLDVSVPPGDYWVRVRANNTCGSSAPSREVAIRVRSRP